ncbi:MAG: DUF4129 domain-containing protein [Planctomycetota bacterium]
MIRNRISALILHFVLTWVGVVIHLGSAVAWEPLVTKSGVTGSVQSSLRLLGADGEPVVPKTVWFDDQTGELTPVDVPVQNDDSVNRGSRWVPDAVQPAKKKATTPAGGATGPTGLGTVLGWTFIGALFVCILVAIFWAFKNSDLDLTTGSQSSARQDDFEELRQQRIQELPLELQQTSLDPRSEVEKLMRDGEYDLAIIALYGHQLLLLDRHHLLRLSRGKTNHQYVREVHREHAEEAGLLNNTVDAFERSYFGRHRLSSTEFQRLWEENTKLEELVESLQEAAA